MGWEGMGWDGIGVGFVCVQARACCGRAGRGTCGPPLFGRMHQEQGQAGSEAKQG